MVSLLVKKRVERCLCVKCELVYGPTSGQVTFLPFMQYDVTSPPNSCSASSSDTSSVRKCPVVYQWLRMWNQQQTEDDDHVGLLVYHLLSYRSC